MVDKIKFGTDGWRAIIAQDYTVANVKRVTYATALWMKSKGFSSVVIGYDCRFGGKMFMEEAGALLCSEGIQVHFDPNFVSTPMVSLGIVNLKADLGIVITASHNPPTYNGFKLKSNYGGPSIQKDIDEVESLIPNIFDGHYESFQHYVSSGKAISINLEEIYVSHAKASFDLELIKSSGLKIAYDAMYGAGQRAMLQLLPNVIPFRCEYNPSFMGQAPEPIAKNLQVMEQYIKSQGNIDLGVANDGDADRIGLFDSNGVFIDSHHILLLLLYYQFKYKVQKGDVVVTFSVTDKMTDLAKKFGLNIEITKIGFKYIAELMVQKDILVGGEESGGLAVKGHIPERDGIWIALMLIEFMTVTKKSLNALIQEIYDEVGSFWVERDDLHLTESQKNSIITSCKKKEFNNFGSYIVSNVENLDGFKFHLGMEKWVLIRPSGTEPVLRVYAQGKNKIESIDILKAVREHLKV